MNLLKQFLMWLFRAKPNVQNPIEDFREVSVYWDNGQLGDKTGYLVHKDEVDTLVEALKKLHVDPGVNPYNQRKTARALRIVVVSPSINGPYWWSKSDLETGIGPSFGAKLVEFNHSSRKDCLLTWGQPLVFEGD